MSHNIRQAKQSEYGALINLWEGSVYASHDFLTEKDITDYRDLLIITSFYDTEIFVIEVNNEIKGFIGLIFQKIQLLFVHAKCFGRGYGTALINFAIDKKKVTHVDVNEQNTRAYHFYFKMGFKCFKRYPMDGSGKNYPVLSMSRVENRQSTLDYLKSYFRKP